ncbi:hypothetical protein BT96DRAFT_989083 [Gymnopus androsaceus JB14]|uniref:Uncharacterized protein n=1 Tax=Gymnopus androsaceus JB14 TaxID=1447944 RepID=A0A6A4HZC8_9AGAR|nr:hypothetical protein BT96DRAFT_989083 [Gymnopus androsaceus JB14]
MPDFFPLPQNVVPSENLARARRRQPLDLTALSTALEKVQSSPPTPLHEFSPEIFFRPTIDVDAPFRPGPPKEFVVQPVMGTVPTLPAPPDPAQMILGRRQTLPALLQPAERALPILATQTTFITLSNCTTPAPPPHSSQPVPSILTRRPWHTIHSFRVCTNVYPGIHPYVLRMQSLIASIPCPILQCNYMVQQTIEGIRAHLVSHHPNLYASFFPPGASCSCGNSVQGGGESVAHHIATVHFHCTGAAKCIHCPWVGTEMTFAAHLLTCPNLAPWRIGGSRVYPFGPASHRHAVQTRKRALDLEAEDPTPTKRQRIDGNSEERSAASAESDASSNFRVPLAARSAN